MDVREKIMASAKTLWLISRRYDPNLDVVAYPSGPFLRPCSVSYEEIIGGKTVTLDGQCKQYEAGERPSEIILRESINGVMIDFHMVIDEDYRMVSLMDVHTGKKLVENYKVVRHGKLRAESAVNDDE